MVPADAELPPLHTPWSRPWQPYRFLLSTTDATVTVPESVDAGGIVLAGFYMATDPVTSPMTRWGRVAFGAFIGALAFLLRFHGSAVEGIGLAVLLGNCVAPLLDRWTRPRRSTG